MVNTYWTGCSLTWGEDFDEQDRELYIYDRIVCREMSWQHTNRAKKGASNHLIFLSASQGLMTGKFDKIFVQWSALNRLWFFPGPDSSFFTNDKHDDFAYRNLYITPHDKTKLMNLILLLNHDFHNILQLIDYCCILDIMSQKVGCEIYFINGLIPWTPDIGNKMTNFSNLDETLSAYTKEILDFDSRDDQEIIGFLKILQEKFSILPKHLWINLFDSMHRQKIDQAPNGNHPGIKSHKKIADTIIKFFHTRKNEHA